MYKINSSNLPLTAKTQNWLFLSMNFIAMPVGHHEIHADGRQVPGDLKKQLVGATGLSVGNAVSPGCVASSQLSSDR